MRDHGRSGPARAAFGDCGKLCMRWLILLLLAATEAAGKPSVHHDNADSIKVDPVEDLQMVIGLWRHGDRAPMASSTYPAEDPDAEKAWTDGYEQLTPKGLEQHYKLGQYLHKRYSRLLKDIKKTEIYAESSSYARTLQSGDANLAALFPPTKSMGLWNSGNSLSSIWQPTPLFSTRPIGQDAVFAVATCPALVEMQQYPLTLATELGYQDIMDYLSDKTGLSPTTFPVSFYRIHDILYCNAQHGVPQPSWATPDVIKQTYFWADAALRLVQGGRKGQDLRLQKSLRGGVMIKMIMDALVAHTMGSKGKARNHVKFHLFSGHDTNIAALMALMQRYDYDTASPLKGIPEYASSIVFELFRNNTVRVVLRDNPPENFDRAPVVVKHPECGVFCPVDQLVRLMTPYYMTEAAWFEACNRTADPNFDVSKYPFQI